MKVIFVLASPGAFIFYDEVVRFLVSYGHTVEIWHGPLNKASLTDRALRIAQSETGNCLSSQLRLSKWRHIAWDIRGLVDCGIYFEAAHPSPWLEERWEKNLSPFVRKILRFSAIRKWLFGPTVQRFLRYLERHIPVDKGIVHHLTSAKADVLVASPYIYGKSLEVDYIKAARYLGIPTMAVVQSWDNLTTKGTYHIMPDVLMVWNHSLSTEATQIHAVPQDRIVVTGAPRFDAWFATRPSRSRADFNRLVGLDPKDQYVAYLCSSNSIAGDETAFVKEFAQALFSNEETKYLKILLRPYPSNAAIWKKVELENMVVWPSAGDIPDTPEARKNFYDSLYYGVAVFGVNTTAFLEAAIVDKPCVTAFTEHYRRTQIESAHFQHLLQADFIEIANGFGEVARLLSAILRGADNKAENRRRFVQEFVRPWGVDQPAAPIMAEVILRIGKGEPVDVVRQALTRRF